MHVSEIDLLPNTENKLYKVVALEVNGYCDYIESHQLIELKHPNSTKHLNNLYSIYENVATHLLGAKLYEKNSKLCHQISGKIWQFRKGNIRVLWFNGRGKIIICSHCFIKNQNKTPKKEIEKAQKLLEFYESNDE